MTEMLFAQGKCSNACILTTTTTTTIPLPMQNTTHFTQSRSLTIAHVHSGVYIGVPHNQDFCENMVNV